VTDTATTTSLDDALSPELAERTVALVRHWLEEGARVPVNASAGRLAGVLKDPKGLAFTVGFVDGVGHLDLQYTEDSRAEVDMNVAMTDAGAFVEVQGTAEGAAFDRGQLDAMLALAEGGITSLFAMQRAALEAVRVA